MSDIIIKKTIQSGLNQRPFADVPLPRCRLYRHYLRQPPPVRFSRHRRRSPLSPLHLTAEATVTNARSLIHIDKKSIKKDHPIWFEPTPLCRCTVTTLSLVPALSAAASSGSLFPPPAALTFVAPAFNSRGDCYQRKVADSYRQEKHKKRPSNLV